MSDDLRRTLHATAAAPTRDLDAPAVVRRARRQRHVRRTATGAAAIALVAGVAVGGTQLLAAPGPGVADAPPGSRVPAAIDLLDRPAGPDDHLPEVVVDELDLDERTAATARLARRTPGLDVWLYVDETPDHPQPAPGPAVCLAILHGSGTEVTGACGARRVPSATHTPIVLTVGGLGTVGVAPDGITAAPQIADGETLPDVPVVNNVFVDVEPAVVDEALAGRGDDAFCALAPGADGAPEDLPRADDALDLLEQMATTAPPPIADDMYLVWDHLRVHPDAIGVDGVEFPDHVRPAANRVDDHIRAACLGLGDDPTEATMDPVGP